MTNKMNDNDPPRYCKKCGEELPSTEKHKLCINCRRMRGSKIRKIGLAIAAFVVSCLTGKQLNKNPADNPNDDQNEENDNYRKV